MVIQILLFSIIVTLLFTLLKEIHFTFAFLLVCVSSIIILVVILEHVKEIITFITIISEKTAITDEHISILLKIIGIAYLTEIGASLSRDAGLQSIASKVELVGKIMIIMLAIPIIYSIIELITTIIPTYTNFSN